MCMNTVCIIIWFYIKYLLMSLNLCFGSDGLDVDVVGTDVVGPAVVGPAVVG